MHVLCVAEKPSIARSISQILSGGQLGTRNTGNKFIKNFDFDYPRTNSSYTVTSVSGHITEYDFYATHRPWYSCDPFALFDAPVEVKIKKDGKTIETNLMNEARRAQLLMIWTDCDREGENIGAEIVTICKKANRQLRVKRARFSAIIPQQIHNAAQNPVDLDQAQADAVEARTILDLRLGAAFTRMQTLSLRGQVDQLKDNNGPISYGPCQFPTLGFVVSRYEQVRAFSPEPFWYIYLSLVRRLQATNEKQETEFTWQRGRLFDFASAAAIYEAVLTNPTAKVTKMNNKSTKKWKPLPLTTVELQKAGSRLLKLAPKKVLDIAEKLYQQGFLSYPRTETDQFDPQFDFMTLIGKQTVDPAWGAFAAQLQQGGFSTPRKGKKNDKAHPPIHPTAHNANLVGEEKKVYEFVTRRFLACCSKDAEGWETNVEILCGGEFFSATGLVVLERNYLDVYPYDKWTGKILPEFDLDEKFMPSVCELRDGETTRPSLLTEADLVGLMDKNGIGTDATIAQHIQTIIDREYVLERMEGSIKYLVPSTLGIGLIEGYNAIGFDKSLSKPQLRRDTERTMVQVCDGMKTKDDMLLESIEQYKDVFIKAKRDFDKVVSSVRKYLNNNEEHQNDNGAPRGRQRDRNDAGPGRGNGGGGGGDDHHGGGGGGRVGGNQCKGADAGSRPAQNRRPHSKNMKHGEPLANVDTFEQSVHGAVANGLAASGHVSKPANIHQHSVLNYSLDLTTESNSTPTLTVDSVKCRCDVTAGERTVVKEGPNKGRKFWTCGAKQDCGFFEWMDGPSSIHTNPSSVPQKRSMDRSDFPSRNSDMQNTRLCSCDLTAVQKTVVKEGPNQGRKFWVCPNSEKARCGYFEWEDNSSDASPGISGGFNNSENQSGSQTTGDCFKCGQPGHWASSCPNGGVGDRQRTKSFGSAISGNVTIGSCFKCGQEGHYSNACNQQYKSVKGSTTKSSRGRNASKRGKATRKSKFSAADEY